MRRITGWCPMARVTGRWCEEATGVLVKSPDREGVMVVDLAWAADRVPDGAV
jgi:hypothetical protein